MHRLLLTLIVITLTGCVSHTERLPTTRDLTGRFIGDDGGYFIFTADKKMSYHAIPATWADAKAAEGAVVSGSGEWRIEKDIIVVKAKDDPEAGYSPRERQIVTFDVQGWTGLFVEITRRDGSSSAVYYVPPGKK